MMLLPNQCSVHAERMTSRSVSLPKLGLNIHLVDMIHVAIDIEAGPGQDMNARLESIFNV